MALAVRSRGRDQRGPHSQGLPDWQPQPQPDATAAAVRQPQVQDSPMQGLQGQADVSVFMSVFMGCSRLKVGRLGRRGILWRRARVRS